MRLITCENLTLGYEGKAILSGLDFSVDSGDYLCIVGENGSGKSTLMKTLLHLQQPMGGSITTGEGLKINGLLWGFPVPIILALLLNRIRRNGVKKKVQLLVYMPNFISVIVLCGMVRMLLSPVGPLNKLLGISTNWMTMPSAFRTIYIASGIWQTAGWASIMYTAALSNASKELEEAAIMDGANLLQQIWYVELPAIKNIIVIQFILQAGNIMSIGFEKAYALQTDMNLPASEILSTYVYRIGLLNGDYGYSTAVGLFNSVVNVILLVFVNWVVKKLNDGEGL